MNRKSIIITIILFIIFTAAIVFFAVVSSNNWPFSAKKDQEQHITRLIIPETGNIGNRDSLWFDETENEEINILKVHLGEGEYVITFLNFDFDYDGTEEQVVAFRSVTETGSRVWIALFAYDERTKQYRRMWTAPVIAAMPGTISMYIQDLLGDRSICIIVSGMNENGFHTMNVFHKNLQDDLNQPLTALAEIQMDGSISVQEVERPLAYRQGIGRGLPHSIVAYGRDPDSEKLLDRIEIIYNYNSAQGIYQQTRITRIPGTQIEQRRLREILTGEPKGFEEFLNDLWYYVSPQGSIIKSQYLYFDPSAREVIFYGDEAQQVFRWQNSNSTRYGLLVSGFNISVTTMRRFLDIELESLDSIKLRVIENARLKIRVTDDWDGSYRRAENIIKTNTSEKFTNLYTEAVYDSSMGRIRFFPNGEYILNSSDNVTKGRYVFFKVSGNDLLELRPEQNNGENRQIYHILNAVNFTGSADNIIKTMPDSISLTRVRLGSAGIQELHEGQIIFTRAR